MEIVQSELDKMRQQQKSQIQMVQTKAVKLEELENSQRCAEEEIKYLRHAKAETTKERDDLQRDLQAY